MLNTSQRSAKWTIIFQITGARAQFDSDDVQIDM